MGTSFPELSVVDQVLWKVDSETEIFVLGSALGIYHIQWSEGFGRGSWVVIQM